MSRQVANVSVIIPCFRSAGSVARAVESALAQTVLPCELIAVDDGSDDGTIEILRRLQGQCPDGWMKVIELPVNKGVAAARNAAWDLAKSKYIAFLDSDDTWHRRKIELQWQWMVANPSVALSCHALPLFTTSGRDAAVPAIRFKEITMAKLLRSNVVLTPTVMIKREVRHRFADGQRHSEDYLLWLLLRLGGSQCAISTAPLAFRYKHIFGAGGLSGELWHMERAELNNYFLLFKEGMIGPMRLAACWMYSLAKFLRRAAISMMRRSGWL